MANLSNADGTITIKAKSTDAIYNLLLAQRYADAQYEYRTELTSSNLNATELKSDIENISFTNQENLKVYTDTFYGIGRWSFECNVNWFMDCLELDSHDPDDIKEAKLKAQNEYYLIQFEIKDEECGCEMLYEATATIEYNPETKKSNISYDIIQEYDYTRDNLIKVGFYTDDELFSINDVIENFDNYTDYWGIDEELIINHKQDIINILKKLPNKDYPYVELYEIIEYNHKLEMLFEELEYQYKKFE